MDTIGFHSPTWRAVKTEVNSRIAELKDQLANPDCDERTSQFIRGRIYELNLLLDLELEPPR